VLHLKRTLLSVTSETEVATHHIPGNSLLPEHTGMLITRGLQEWACLLPQQLPFASAARLLGWQAHEERPVLATTTLRNLVRAHGQILRETEVAEAERLLETLKQPNSEAPKPRLLPSAGTSHRRPGWPSELCASVEEALTAASSPPPRE
jgi:hypothetical protein